MNQQKIPSTQQECEKKEEGIMFDVQVYPTENINTLENKKVIFHAPNKCGTLCLRKVLVDTYSVHMRKHQYVLYNSNKDDINSLISLLKNTDNHIYISGHYLYGAIPTTHDIIILSQLRHPLPRVISCYQWLFNKHLKKHNTTEAFPSLEQFIINGKGKANSLIIQFGIGYGSERKKLMKELNVKDIYSYAIENIDNDIMFIGIAEHFEETIFYLSYLLGLTKVPRWFKDTRNTNRPLISEVNQSTLDLIKDVYRYDFMLYDWVLKRFQKQISKVQFGSSLDRYKAACQNEYKDRIL